MSEHDRNKITTISPPAFGPLQAPHVNCIINNDSAPYGSGRSDSDSDS